MTLQWSPVLETGNTSRGWYRAAWRRVAAMEPGLRDREYHPNCDCIAVPTTSLQWSPVLETGNTARRKTRCWLLVLQAFASAVNRPSVRGRRGRLPEGVNMALTRGRAVLRRALRTSALARRSGPLAGAAARAGRRR